MRLAGRGAAGASAPTAQDQANRAHREVFRSNILLVESAMADFLYPQPSIPAQDSRGTQGELETPISDDYARL